MNSVAPIIIFVVIISTTTTTTFHSRIFETLTPRELSCTLYVHYSNQSLAVCVQLGSVSRRRQRRLRMQQGQRGRLVVIGSCDCQRREAATGGAVAVSTSRQQRLNDLHMAVLSCHVQRSEPLGSYMVHLRARLQQRPSHLRLKTEEFIS